ncbi:hypothetical protein [Microcella frigidaquae]|uniref:Uncharacterized protein n=1 Tax=Microcella frigidaquae TaxID=424758 RepID=A0A840X769_9MICO|nr:hypothetical protein [Microcella frigidaquae]MBB5618230.1 hypothetical protein [Microcella frigidaquae]NHN44435.1 hypothetical protein [Microcella frigidaquae]
MISPRLRAVIAGVPIVLIAVLGIDTAAQAADALRITAPAAGTTVSGPLAVEGAVTVDRAVEVQVGLAPQLLGECGAVVVSRSVEGAGAFTVSIPTTEVPDGVYCLVAVADAGHLSAVLADITVNNTVTPGEEVDELQLSTQALGGTHDADPLASTAPPAMLSLGGNAPLLGAVVLALTLALAVVALGAGLWGRRRTAA